MDRITATPDALVRQACETAERYLSHAIRWVKEQELPRKDWPTFVGIYVQAAAQDFLAAVTLAGLQDLEAGLNSAIMTLADATTTLADVTQNGLDGVDKALSDLAGEVHRHSKEAV